MRIGIDARFLTHPQHGGFKTYTRTLVTSLASADRENEYILYTDRPSDMGQTLPHNFRVKPVSAANAIVREQIALPRMMEHDGVEIAHFPCSTAPMFRHPKMVVTIHDAIALHNTHKRTGRKDLKHRLLNTYWRTVIPRAAKACHLVIANSRFAQQDLMNTLGTPEDKFRLVRIAVDPMFSDPRPGVPPAGLGVGDGFLLAFAAMDGRKNHLRTIEAYRTLQSHLPDTKLALVCSHPSLREQLSGEADGVIPVGPVTPDELLWLYRHGRLLVFPSLDEGYGLPPLEAMAVGMPVVASHTGSLPEVLGGMMMPVEPTDPSSIADGIMRVLSNEELGKYLTLSGLRHVSRLSPENMGNGLMSVYTESQGKSIVEAAA